MVGSPMMSCQRSTGIWLVMSVAPRACRRAAAHEQQRLQRRAGQPFGQRPDQAGRDRPASVVAHRAARQPRAARDRPVAQPFGPQPQYLPDTSHRHSLGWHRLSPCRPGSLCGSTRDRAPAIHSVADFKSESVADFRRNRWPASNRNQWPTSNRNRWPTCSGIRIFSPAQRQRGLRRSPLHCDGRAGLIRPADRLAPRPRSTTEGADRYCIPPGSS